MIKFSKFLSVLLIIISLSACPGEGQEDVLSDAGQVEVLSVAGRVKATKPSGEIQNLREGDLLSIEATLESESGASADLAYDKDWNNVAHLEENSRVRIDSIYPAQLSLTQGSVWAKLKSLPRGSSFQIETPTAVAVVRGTEYRALVENDEGQIFNFSDSQVYVFGKDPAGQLTESPLILENAQTSGPLRLGRPLPTPRAMTADENRHGHQLRARLNRHVEDNRARGRVGRLPDVRTIEKIHQNRQHLFGSGRMFSQEGGGNNAKRMKENFDRQDRFMRAMDSAGESHKAAKSLRDQEVHSLGDESRPGSGGPPADPGGGGSGQAPRHGPSGSLRSPLEGRVHDKSDFRLSDKQSVSRQAIGGGLRPEGPGGGAQLKPSLHKDGRSGASSHQGSASRFGNRPATSRPKHGQKR